MRYCVRYGVLVAVLLAACARHAPAVTLDPGGFTVDLTRITSTPAAGDDLLVAGDGRLQVWQPSAYVWLPEPDPAATTAMRKRIDPTMVREFAPSPERGQPSAHLVIPASVYDANDPVGHEVCAFLHQAVPVSGEQAVKYVLSFEYRGMAAFSVANCRAYVRVTFYDNVEPSRAKQTRVYAQQLLAASDAWRAGELAFVAPEGTRCLDVRLAWTGYGEAWFDNVTLHRAAQQDAGVTVRLMPWSYLDNLYCLSSGDAGTMIFGFRNEAGAPIDRPQLVLELPGDVQVLDISPQESMQQEQAADGMVRYRIDLNAIKSRIHDGTFRYPYNMWEGQGLLLRTDLSPGEKRYVARYWLEDGDYRTAAQQFEMQVVPALPTVAAPARFRSGAHLFRCRDLQNPQATEAFAQLFTKVGFNSVNVPPSPLGEALHRHGIERYVQPIANGYRMGDRTPGAKPADAVFRLADGSPLWEAICPTEVYHRGAYYREQIEGELFRRILLTDRSGEQVMANWEPFMYNGRGCFCDRCRAEFQQYGKLSGEQMQRVWPDKVIEEYGDLWTRFRSWQHGRLMVTLEQSVSAIGREAGLDAHFIPEISYKLVVSTWDQIAGNRAYAAVDYLGELPVLEPWGPYNWYVFGSGPYDYVRGLHLSSHVTASEVRRFIAAQLPDSPQPRLIAFPYGTYEGVTQPEALAFEFMTYFVHGYEGAFAYLYPGGYDARYWRVMAETNRQIAMFEPFVMDGRRVDHHELVPQTPLPKPDPRFLDKCGVLEDAQQWRDLSLLQIWQFDKDGATLVAVGNFWERGECFFRLKFDALPQGDRFVLREPAAGRVYADDTGRVALDAETLSQGVLLHVGAMRYAFFIIEPWREGADYGQVVASDQMIAAMQQRLPAIEASGRGQ